MSCDPSELTVEHAAVGFRQLLNLDPSLFIDTLVIHEIAKTPLFEFQRRDCLKYIESRNLIAAIDLMVENVLRWEQREYVPWLGPVGRIVIRMGDPRAEKIMMQWSREPNYKYRSAALGGLEMIGSDAAFIRIVDMAKNDPDVGVQWMADSIRSNWKSKTHSATQGVVNP